MATVKQQKPEWAVTLAEILDLWCHENGYSVKTMLADELGIPRNIWNRISTGGMIASDIEAYAKIYQRTGLEESDPKSIPPRRIFIPKTGSYAESLRAWSDEEWQAWLSNQSKPSEPRSAVGQNSSSPPMVPDEKVVKPERPRMSQGSFPTVGNLIDQLITSLGHQVAQVIREDLGSGGIPPNREEDIGRLMVKLTGKLKEMHAATREERDLFIGRYGIQIGSLHANLDPFIRNPEDRERAIKLGERFVQ